MVPSGELDVTIVGGGIAGLCIAHEIIKANPEIRWKLFEASDRLGGKILSERIEHEDGRFIVEAGPDAFLAQKPWGRELAVELGLAGSLLPINDSPTPAAILKNGRPIDLPAGVSLIAPTRIGPFLRTPLLSPLGKARAGLDFVLPARQDSTDESMGSFARRRLGREMLDWIAEPLMAGIYNADPDELSLQATFPQFQAMEQKRRSVIRGLRATRPKTSSAQKPPAFLTLRNGMQELVDALAAHLGHNAQTKTVVVRVERRNERFDLTLSDGTSIASDTVILAVPAIASADIVEAVAPSAAARLRGLRASTAGTISLAYRTSAIERPLNGYGLVVPARERAPINAITDATRKFPGRAPGGWTLLRVFFGGARSPRTMELDDEQLLVTVQRQLHRLLGISEDPAFHRIYRWGAGSPLYAVGHLDQVAAVEAALPDGLFVTGSPYRGVGIPDIARNSRDIVDAVIARTNIRPKVELLNVS